MMVLLRSTEGEANADKNAANLKTQLNRAFQAMERGKYHQARRQLERLLPSVQDDPSLAEQVYLALADACLTLRDLPQASWYAEAALAFNPNSEQGHYLLGFAHSVPQSWSAAVSALRQAVDLNPEQPEYYRALGWALFNQGQTQEGQTLLEQALHMAPTHLDTLTDLAMLHSQAQQFDQALIFARRAVQLAPGDRRAQELLAGISHFQREFERLSGRPKKKARPHPETEADWRALIAATDDHKQLMQLWLDLHPGQDLAEINASLQQFNDLWNSTPRPELGGRSPTGMMGRPGQTR